MAEAEGEKPTFCTKSKTEKRSLITSQDTFSRFVGEV